MTDAFINNVQWARECGYDLVCAECGCGIYDESDDHDLFCSHNPERAANEALRASWEAKQAQA